MQVASLIPQIYYDIIARLYPGVVLIGSSYVVIVGPGKAWANLGAWLHTTSGSWPTSVLVLVGIGIAAYGVAITLTAIWECGLNKLIKPLTLRRKKSLRKGSKRTLRGAALKDLKKAAQHLGINRDSLKSAFPSTWFMFDYVRMADPVAGARLVKMRAEYRMCEVLATGWLLLFLPNLPRVFIKPSLALAGTLVVLAVLIISVLHTRNRLRQFFRLSLYHHWLLLPIREKEEVT